MACVQDTLRMMDGQVWRGGERGFLTLLQGVELRPSLSPRISQPHIPRGSRPWAPAQSTPLRAPMALWCIRMTGPRRLPEGPLAQHES